MVSIPLWALYTLWIKGFLSLARPFLDLVSHTPRPRGGSRPLVAELGKLVRKRQKQGCFYCLPIFLQSFLDFWVFEWSTRSRISRAHHNPEPRSEVWWWNLRWSFGGKCFWRFSPAKEARKSPSKLRRKFATNFAENFANFTLEIAGA